MRVLMLGNSYTARNNLSDVLASLTGWEVVSHTRGGARLAEQYNAETEMGRRTLKALAEEKWDYVVMQEQSFAPAGTPDAFLASAGTLCGLIRESGAAPVFYATWAYRDGSDKLAGAGLDYETMYARLHASYAEAARRNNALLADVGSAFRARKDTEDLYDPDGSHPNEAGTRLAAEVIRDAILNDMR